MTANLELHRKKEWEKLRGFSNLLWKENKGWWQTRRWWINAVIWTGMLGGLVFLMAFVLPSVAETVDDPNVAAAGGPAAFGLEMGKNVFFELGTVALAIGVMVLCLDMIVQEKQSGVTEWLLAKPVARRSYILAKIWSAVQAVVLLLIILPAITGYLLLSLRAGAFLPPMPFLAGVGIMTTHTLFYLCLTLMLGAFFNSRAPILGISIASIMGGSMIAGMVKPLGYFTPWMLAKLANLVTTAQPIPLDIVISPVAASLVWCITFTALGIWKLERTEF